MTTRGREGDSRVVSMTMVAQARGEKEIEEKQNKKRKRQEWKE